MWQSCLAPTAVEETNSGVFVRHVGRCCIYDLSREIELKSSLLALLSDDVVDSSHEPID